MFIKIQVLIQIQAFIHKCESLAYSFIMRLPCYPVWVIYRLILLMLYCKRNYADEETQ